MKRFVRFGPDDERALQSLCELARPQFGSIVQEFYERSREHEEAHAVFRSEEQIARLQSMLVAWLERVLSGPHDNDYSLRSARIGEQHVAVGLPQRFMFTAMTLFRLRLQQVALDEMGDDARAALDALGRVFDLELALMSETYHRKFAERLERSERELHGSVLSRRYVAAVELAGTMIVGLDAEERIQLFNRAAEQISGFGFDEVYGVSFTELLVVDPEDSGFTTAFSRILDAPAQETASTDVAWVTRTRSGRIREMRGRLSRAALREDDELLVFVVGRDVTDETAMAARLRRSEKLAAVGTLAAGLAHEIRNPLNGAQLHLTYLKRALNRMKASDDLVDALDVVRGEVRRLSDLVTDFLDFARPRDLNRQPLNVQDLCQQSIDMVRPAASEAKVALKLELPASPIQADLDVAMMKQVLLNLLNNGIQAIESDSGGGVTLRVVRRPLVVVLEVIDDGPGIPDSRAPIFDAFYSTKPKGTGLGLAIVHRIVTDHGGSVSVESEPGHTVFTLVLPLYDPENPPSSVAAGIPKESIR